MLTQTVAGRVYDYSYAVGGRYLPQIVGMAIGEGDTVYSISRPTDAISGVAWNKIGVGSKVVKLTIGTVAGDEEHDLRRIRRRGLPGSLGVYPSGPVQNAIGLIVELFGVGVQGIQPEQRNGEHMNGQSSDQQSQL